MIRRKLEAFIDRRIARALNQVVMDAAFSTYGLGSKDEWDPQTISGALAPAIRRTVDQMFKETAMR